MNKRLRKIFLTDIEKMPGAFYLTAFFLPVFLMAVAIFSWHVRPSGDASLLTCDLYCQIAPFLSELRRKILSGESLFFSWNIGMGTNFLPIIGYYGASPLNALLLFFPEKYLSDAITYLILLRVGLSGLFFSRMLVKSSGKTGPGILALSTAYALCGFVLSYYWVMMWMDAIVLLPLLVIGLRKIFEGGRPLTYTVSLFLAILSNFYIGFFVCVFLLLFAPLLYMETRQSGTCRTRPGGAVLRFAGYSAVAGAMTAAILLPTLIALRSTSAASDSVIWTADMSFTVFDFLSRFLLHADPVIREGLPNVYCSVAVLLLIPLYALCRTIPFKRRMTSLGLAFLLYITMNSPVTNYLWHGMHYTNQIPYRQAFLLSFLLLYMAGDVLRHLDGLSRKLPVYAGGAVLIYLTVLKIAGDETVSNWLIYGSAAFAVIYSVILSGAFAGGRRGRLAGSLFLCAMIFELFFAAEFALKYIDDTEHLTYAPSYGQYAQEIRGDIKASDGGLFARTAILPAVTGNDGALYGYKTLSVFSSTCPVRYAKFMAGLGLANNGINDVQADGLTDVTARLLGIRNIVEYKEPEAEEIDVEPALRYDSDLLSTNRDEETAQEEKTDILYAGFTVTTDRAALPVGFFVPSESVHIGMDSSVSPFEKTNALLKGMGGRAVYMKGTYALSASENIRQSSEGDDVSILTDARSASITLVPDVSGVPTAEAEGDRDVLLYLGTDQECEVRVTRMDDEGRRDVETFNPTSGQIIDCGHAEESGGKILSVQVVFSDPVQQTFPIYCYTIDTDALDETTDLLAATPLTVASYDSSHLAGTVNFAGGGTLLTSIPYDSGWTVRVDGKKAVAEAAYGALLSVDVAAGTHEITFSYESPGFFPGLLISLISAVGFLILSIWICFKPVKRKGPEFDTAFGIHSEESPQVSKKTDYAGDRCGEDNPAGYTGTEEKEEKS